MCIWKKDALLKNCINNSPANDDSFNRNNKKGTTLIVGLNRRSYIGMIH